MTIREITDLTGLSKQTILNKIKQKYPLKIEHGKTTRLNREESISIVNDLKVEVSKNLTVESNNLTVPERNINIQIIDQFSKALELFSKTLLTLDQRINALESKPQRLQIEQDYFCILGYASKKGIKLSFSERIELGKEATKLSLEMKKEKRYIEDEHYGKVGSYHISVLEKVFEI